VNHWIEQGMPREKINMGVASYGRTYELADPKQTNIGAAAIGAGKPGPFTREAGFLAYHEVGSHLAHEQLVVNET
jgi:GH18 family chitinase